MRTSLLNSDVDELHALARDLVSIPSHEAPDEAGDRIEAWLRSETEASVRRDDAGNVLARRIVDGRAPGAPDGSVGDSSRTDVGAGPTLALVGHHDVVPPADEQVDDGRYVVERRDGRLYGRGSADMKGALAAMLLAFRDASLARAETAPGPDGADCGPPSLVVASFVGEEVGGEGARHAVDRGFAPDWAVVGEGSSGYSAPGVTDVAVAHKGRRASTVVASGRSAHASVPEEGSNAIYAACDAVERLRSIEPPRVAVGDDVLEGSLVVTEIDGGSAWNVVPDRCTVTVDERTVPGERAPIETVAELDDVAVEVEQDLPPMRCGDDELASLVLDAARSVQADADAGEQSDEDAGVGEGEAAASTPRRVAKPHATDAGWLSDAGVECVVCGPAEPGEAHTAEESVSLAVLERCYRIYRRVAERFPPDGGDATEAR